jgi:sulfide:quinone oxidoreductase
VAKPSVVILGGNFAGLEAAQQLRRLAGDAVDITVIDRKPYLLFVPNIGLEVFANKDPARSMFMDIAPVLAEDGSLFVPGEVTGLDVDTQIVRFLPTERPGAPEAQMHYDYVVVALGARLAYDRIEGFAEYGHTVSDTFYGNRLRHYLYHEYRGGPAAVGSARFHQGTMSRDLIPTADAACEGPPVEVTLALGSWLKEHGHGGPELVTVFTPGAVIAEDAGSAVVEQLLALAGKLGYHYWNGTQDIVRLTAEGIEFADGRQLEAELKVIFPDWVPHPFLKGLPISDDQGFILTDRTMRHPRYHNVFAAGDAAALTVPKLGWLAHLSAEVVARQIAKDMGRLSAERADLPFRPSVNCIGDMGGQHAFAINSDAWYGGSKQQLTVGRLPYLLKQQYKDLFFRTRGKVPNWGMPLAEFLMSKL